MHQLPEPTIVQLNILGDVQLIIHMRIIHKFKDAKLLSSKVSMCKKILKLKKKKISKQYRQ